MNKRNSKLSTKISKNNRTLDSYLKGVDNNCVGEQNSNSIPKIKIPATSGFESTMQFIQGPFIYPRYPEFREYQYQISRECVKNNTLVCLPTGLGKTLIASVLICNYYKWFPEGKIFFLAPTRPLVDQQTTSLSQFSHIIQPSHIISIKGNFAAKKRIEAYKEKRVFFCTPQTLENDLKESRLEPNKIVLVIFDEAHKAVGNYSYTQIVRQLQKNQFGFRIIALSATPGNLKQSIQEVIQNLRIAKLVSRNQDDPDVSIYLKHKRLEPVIIKSSEVIRETEQILQHFSIFPLNSLRRLGIINPFIIKNGLSKATVYLTRLQIKQKIHNFDVPTTNFIYNSLKYLSFLAEAKDALKNAGYECFRKRFIYPFRSPMIQKGNKQDTQYSNFQKSYEKSAKENYKPSFGNKYDKLLTQDPQFQKACDLFTNNVKKGTHPKLQKLKQLLIDFFTKQENIQRKSKAIIFAQYRQNCYEIKKYISDIKQVRAKMFYGQSKTIIEQRDEEGQNSHTETLKMNQKQQQNIIRDFRNNQLNVLISTSIGEQGLDIGEVDCIFCYTGGMSIIRMIQRMGRTGRKRDGIVYMLLMEGKEADDYYKASKKSKNIKKTILGSNFKFYPYNPTMLKSGQIKVQFFDKPTSQLDEKKQQKERSEMISKDNQKKTKKNKKTSKVRQKQQKPIQQCSQTDSDKCAKQETKKYMEQAHKNRYNLLNKYLSGKLQQNNENQSSSPNWKITKDKTAQIYQEVCEQTFKQDTFIFNEQTNFESNLSSLGFSLKADSETYWPGSEEQNKSNNHKNNEENVPEQELINDKTQQMLSQKRQSEQQSQEQVNLEEISNTIQGNYLLFNRTCEVLKQTDNFGQNSSSEDENIEFDKILSMIKTKQQSGSQTDFG